MRSKMYLFIIALFARVLVTADEGIESFNLNRFRESHFTWHENSPLVQVNDKIKDSTGTLSLIMANPSFVEILPDLHFLVKRSYRSTKRDQNKKYIERHMLEQDEYETIPETKHNWHCIKNFQGQQGEFVTPSWWWKMVKNIISVFVRGKTHIEVDYPGFIAYKTDCQSYDVIWLSVVLRGSQGEDFQPFGGMLGSSWITNFSAGAVKLTEDTFPFTGKVHSGYLNKMLSCEISMNIAINEALCKIDKSNFSRVKFIVTGHSQGGGLAQIALPMIIKNFSYIYGDDFDNNETPRFFGYFMSPPCVSHGKETLEGFNKIVGKHNMIRHEAYGDVVPMACLSGYIPLGVLAMDTFYDVLCRSVKSEIAYCNRYALFQELKYLFDPDKFDIDEKNDVWTSKSNSNFKIHWTEIAKTVGSQHILRDLSVLEMFNSFLISAFRIANTSKIFCESENLPKITDESILSLMKEWYDTRNIELLVKHFAFFEDIELDEKRKEMLFILSNECENYIGNTERLGIKNTVSCAKFLNDLSNVANSENKFAVSKILQQVKVIPNNGVVIGNALSPVGRISAIASTHFGSGANYYKSSLFDKNVPSKDINLALRNGAELLRPKKNSKDRCIFIYEEGLPEILLRICGI